MKGTRRVVEYNKSKFLVAKRNYITNRRETQKWEVEGGEELLFFPTTAFQKGADLRENLGREMQLCPCQNVGRKNRKIERLKHTEVEKITTAFFSFAFLAFLPFSEPLALKLSHKFQRDQVDGGKQRSSSFSHPLWGSVEPLSLTLAAFKAPPKEPVASVLLRHSSISNLARVSCKKNPKMK